MRKTIRKILIVNYEYEFCKTFQRHLKSAGFITFYALSGIEAFQKIQNAFNSANPFDLMIVDTIMLYNGGVGISQRIIKDYSSVSFLYFTACGDFDMVEEIMRPNMDNHSNLPPTPQKMLELIDNIDHNRESLFKKNKKRRGYDIREN